MWVGKRRQLRIHLSSEMSIIFPCLLSAGSCAGLIQALFPPSRKVIKKKLVHGICFVLSKLSVLSMRVNELFCINLQVFSCI